MSPQRRTALVSVVAACALIALKLVTGLVTHSLGLVSEAIHSGTDLVAAMLTFFAVGVAVRPAGLLADDAHHESVLVAYLTLAVDGETTLGVAHARASRIEERVRAERPDIADVIVHTEP